MATTTRQENSREQSVRNGNETEVRGGARQEQPARREGSQVDSRERERSLETGRDVSTASTTGTARRQHGAGRGYPHSPTMTTAGSPFALMSRMMDDMDRLFADFGLGPVSGSALLPELGFRGGRDQASTTQRPGRDRALARGSWMPQMEVFTRGNELVARADLPGLRRDDISVEILDDHLVIQGERRSDREERGDGFFHSERSYGSFMRSIPLPEGTDGEAIQARFADGVLEVTVPLPKQEERRKQVEIR